MRTFIWITLPLFLFACGADANHEKASGEVENGCLKSLPACEPAQTPTFDDIFARTLSTSCGNSRCHEPAFRGGGLGLTGSAEGAYADLLEQRDDGANVKPGSPECSPLVLRLYSDDPLLKMPRTGSISADARCSIVQWIADGAKPPQSDSR